MIGRQINHNMFHKRWEPSGRSESKTLNRSMLSLQGRFYLILRQMMRFDQY